MLDAIIDDDVGKIFFMNKSKFSSTTGDLFASKGDTVKIISKSSTMAIVEKTDTLFRFPVLLSYLSGGNLSSEQKDEVIVHREKIHQKKQKQSSKKENSNQIKLF